MNGVTYFEINYDAAWVQQKLAELQGFSWLYEWGMYIFLLVAIAILFWVFFDSITKHKDQQALVPRILAMLGFFFVIPAFIFRFTGNADGVTTLVRLGAEPLTPYYPAAINWNVNWLVRGYGPMIAMVALLGMVLSIIGVVIYASSVQRAKPSTEFVQAFNSQMSNLERKVDDVSRAQANVAPTPAPTPIPSVAPAASSATIIDRKPQAATIIDVPHTGDTLTVRTGNGRGNIYDLPAEDITIGRDASGYIVVDDGKVSGKHLKLTYTGLAWLVFDLGSTNGTYLNGRKLQGQHELVDGDEIRIGDTVLVYGRRR